MNLMLPTRRMTVEEFFAWCEEHPDRRRCELIDGVVVMQQAEQWLHTQLKTSVFMALWRAVENSGLPLFAAPSGPAVRTTPDTAFEPDVIVAQLPQPDPKSYEISTPVILVEVLSPSTRRKDLGLKRDGYFKLPTVRHYLAVDPDAREVVHHFRRHSSGEISVSAVKNGPLLLDPPGLSMDLSSIFGAAQSEPSA
jgi:Uma2 family endonuclease